LPGLLARGNARRVLYVRYAHACRLRCTVCVLLVTAYTAARICFAHAPCGCIPPGFFTWFHAYACNTAPRTGSLPTCYLLHDYCLHYRCRRFLATYSTVRPRLFFLLALLHTLADRSYFNTHRTAVCQHTFRLPACNIKRHAQRDCLVRRTATTARYTPRYLPLPPWDLFLIYYGLTSLLSRCCRLDYAYRTTLMVLHCRFLCHALLPYLLQHSTPRRTCVLLPHAPHCHAIPTARLRSAETCCMRRLRYLPALPNLALVLPLPFASLLLARCHMAAYVFRYTLTHTACVSLHAAQRAKTLPHPRRFTNCRCARCCRGHCPRLHTRRLPSYAFCLSLTGSRYHLHRLLITSALPPSRNTRGPHAKYAPYLRGPV